MSSVITFTIPDWAKKLNQLKQEEEWEATQMACNAMIIKEKTLTQQKKEATKAVTAVASWQTITRLRQQYDSECIEMTNAYVEMTRLLHAANERRAMCEARNDWFQYNQCIENAVLPSQIYTNSWYAASTLHREILIEEARLKETLSN